MLVGIVNWESYHLGIIFHMQPQIVTTSWSLYRAL